MWQAAVDLLLGIAVTSCTCSLHQTLERCYGEQPFQTILLLRHQSQLPCHQMEQVAAAGTWPVLRFNHKANFYLQSSQNSEMLALMCSTGQYKMDVQMWQALARNLYNIRHVRVLVLQQLSSENPDELLRELTDIAEELQFPHVVLIAGTEEVYQLQPYGQKSWLKVELNGSKPVFVRQYNYQERIAKSLPDQITSLSLVYEDSRTQKMKMTGFVARLIEEFARVYNISLQWQRPVVAGEMLSLMMLRNMTLNGTLNLPITLCGFEPMSKVGIFSYPYDIPNWYIMVPCAREIPTAEVFPMLFNWQMLVLLMTSYGLFVLLDNGLNYLLMRKKFDWTYLMCNERMIAGILGQPSNLWPHYTISSRITQAQLFIVGLMISTVFAAHLKTLLTKRPTERQISNFKELRNSRLQVYFEEGEEFYVKKMSNLAKIELVRSKIKYLPTNDFYGKRNSLSTPQAFSITGTELTMIQRQQEFFQQPAFCFYSDLITRYNLLMSIPLEPNSIYVQPLNLFIHRIHSSGLLSYWKQEALLKLIALEQINIKDPYEYESFHEFKVPDLLAVWLTFLFGLLCGFIVFVCELITYRWESKRNSPNGNK